MEGLLATLKRLEWQRHVRMAWRSEAVLMDFETAVVYYFRCMCVQFEL